MRQIISIHAPRTGSDDFVDSLLMQCGISIHAPRTGSDVSPAPIPASAPLFQSTLPARGATLACNFCGIACHISIHAPRTGSDGECLGAEILDSQFQSTLPARGATRHFLNCKRTHRFQSTLPARGATVAGFAAGKIAQISIHAPRTGSDHTSKVTKGVSRYFNPRSPHGERPAGHSGCSKKPDISIHAPRTGSDTRFVCIYTIVIISIHAPRTGSDRHRLRTHCQANPFQSTLPARGATDSRWRRARRAFLFQSTLPARGATVELALRVLQILHISIHAPRTGSDHDVLLVLIARRISIHAPRTGSDAGPLAPIRPPPSAFQSTLPARGATFSFTDITPSYRFQSTLPARGATPPILWRSGERIFQSTLPARGATGCGSRCRGTP